MTLCLCFVLKRNSIIGLCLIKTVSPKFDEAMDRITFCSTLSCPGVSSRMMRPFALGDLLSFIFIGDNNYLFSLLLTFVTIYNHKLYNFTFIKSFVTRCINTSVVNKNICVRICIKPVSCLLTTSDKPEALTRIEPLDDPDKLLLHVLSYIIRASIYFIVLLLK